jgi:hypothetical protein
LVFDIWYLVFEMIVPRPITGGNGGFGSLSSAFAAAGVTEERVITEFGAAAMAIACQFLVLGWWWALGRAWLLFG